MVCLICNKPVLSHSYYLICSSYESCTHLKCLPNVDKTDALYTNRLTNQWICIKCSSSIFPFNHIEDDIEFLSIISENIKNESCLLRQLENISFNLLDLNDDDNISDLVPYTDPDDNYFKEIIYQCCRSNYYDEISFRKKCETIRANNYFSMVHLNIRSMAKNLGNFELYLKSLEFEFDIIGLSETWIKGQNLDFSKIQGYRQEHVYRENRSGGGVSLFVKNIIDYKLRSDINILNDNLEAVFIEINKTQFATPNNIIIGTVYRPPNTDIQLFMHHLKLILDQMDKEGKCVYLMGDFNMNLLNVDKHMPTSEFIEMLYSFSYLPLINKPTRIKNESAILIDNIFCNKFNKSMSVFNGICITDITDHFPIFTINYVNEKNTYVLPLKKRFYTTKNIEKFTQRIRLINWDTVLNSLNAQNAFTCLYTQILTCFQECFPLVNVKLKYANRKPWLTDGMKMSIKTKNKLYIKSIKHPNLFNINNYKKYRNKLHSILRKYERDYYDQLLSLNKSHLRKSWQIIKDVINRNRNKATCNEFNINNKCVTDNAEIADIFNKFFVNVGPNLAKSISNVNVNPTSYIHNENCNSIFINPVTSNEVQNIVMSLKESSPGEDGITSQILKYTLNYFVEPLTHSVNLSLSQGIFPQELKTAKVIPLYKSGDKKLMNNFRPVSVLPVFSKIYERLMYNRLIAFINKHNILYNINSDSVKIMELILH